MWKYLFYSLASSSFVIMDKSHEALISIFPYLVSPGAGLNTIYAKKIFY